MARRAIPLGGGAMRRAGEGSFARCAGDTGLKTGAPPATQRVAVIMISTLMPAPIIWVSTVARGGNGAPTTSR